MQVLYVNELSAEGVFLFDVFLFKVKTGSPHVCQAGISVCEAVRHTLGGDVNPSDHIS